MYFCDAQELEQFTEWLNLQDDIGEPVEPLGNLIRRVQRKAAAARELTLKQRTFALEYARTRNATQSAITAGYSERTAAQMGYKLAWNPKVLRLVDAEVAKRMAIEEARPVDQAQKYKHLMREFVHEKTRRLINIIDVDLGEALAVIQADPNNVPVRVRDAVKSFKCSDDGSFSIVMRCKIRALGGVLKIIGPLNYENMPLQVQSCQTIQMIS